jgi:hypothetical protein
MLKIRCKNCNTELESHPIRTRSCGCTNMTTLRNEVISANDLSLVEIIQGGISRKTQNGYEYLTQEDIQWQESRKNRKVTRLEFEIR